MMKEQLGPDSEYFSVLEGTDQFESLLSDVRMADTKAPNVDTLQFRERASTSFEMHEIYSSHPELRGKMKRRDFLS
jgi:hypothetical protein